jgi:hypothetical protein
MKLEDTAGIARNCRMSDFEYATLINADCDGEPCKPILLNEAQAAGLVVLVTPNTFVIADALAAMRNVHG